MEEVLQRHKALMALSAAEAQRAAEANGRAFAALVEQVQKLTTAAPAVVPVPVVVPAPAAPIVVPDGPETPDSDGSICLVEHPHASTDTVTVKVSWNAPERRVEERERYGAALLCVDGDDVTSFIHKMRCSAVSL
ncbi:uncharacterized protein V6R79_002250 [Siganus canaliculatus]